MKAWSDTMPSSDVSNGNLCDASTTSDILSVTSNGDSTVSTCEALKMNNSDNNQRIGDIFKKYASFFKMYTEYIKDFDLALNTISQTMEKNPKFKAIMNEIHVS